MLHRYREPPIDPPADEWDWEAMEESDYYGSCDFDDEISTEIALHNYECKVYNELDRRII